MTKQPKIIKQQDKPVHPERRLSDQARRSELRLLNELIERNPQRAREFLTRLGQSLRST